MRIKIFVFTLMIIIFILLKININHCIPDLLKGTYSFLMNQFMYQNCIAIIGQNVFTAEIVKYMYVHYPKIDKSLGYKTSYPEIEKSPGNNTRKSADREKG